MLGFEYQIFVYSTFEAESLALMDNWIYAILSYRKSTKSGAYLGYTSGKIAVLCSGFYLFFIYHAYNILRMKFIVVHSAKYLQKPDFYILFVNKFQFKRRVFNVKKKHYMY